MYKKSNYITTHPLIKGSEKEFREVSDPRKLEPIIRPVNSGKLFLAWSIGLASALLMTVEANGQSVDKTGTPNQKHDHEIHIHEGNGGQKSISSPDSAKQSDKLILPKGSGNAMVSNPKIHDDHGKSANVSLPGTQILSNPKNQIKTNHANH